MSQHTQALVKEGADVVSATVVVGTLAEILPPIAAGFAIIWTLIRIYEWARVVFWGLPPRKTSASDEK